MKRFMRFGVCGVAAFIVDAGILWILVGLGVYPLMARVMSISLAMVVAWWGNRTLTFRMTTPPTWREFGRYVLLASGLAGLNYALFAALVVWGGVLPVLATALATGLAMGVSYLGMVWKVFR